MAMPRYPSVIFAGLIAGILLDAPLPAQNDAGGYRIGQVYAGKFPHVSLLLDVSASQSAKVKQIQPADLRLSEDGVAAGEPASLSTFKDSGLGMAIVIAIDVSPSMNGGPLNAIMAAVRDYVAEVTPNDRAALITFADDERVDVPFNSPPDAMRKAIEGLTVRGHATQLYRALVKALQLFEEEPSLPARRRILIISDGRDEKSSYTYDNVAAIENREHIPIDAIGIARDPAHVDTVGQSALERLSDSTGGDYRMATTGEDLRGIASFGIRWLQASPVATFDLRRITADGRRHTLGVQWNAFGGERFADLQAPMGTFLTPSWMWWVASGAALCLMMLVVFLMMRRKTAPAAAPDALPPPVIPPPGPAPPAPAPLERGPRIPTEIHLTPAPNPNPVPAPEPAPAARRPRLKTEIRIEFAAPAPGKPTAYLVPEKGTADTRRIGIDQPAFWIGAGENNNYVINNESVSWNHACIVFEHADLYLWDDSRNGTLLNGERVHKDRRRLNRNDRIEIGGVALRLAAD